MDVNYNKMDDKAPLSTFAALPSFMFKLHYLANQLAEREDWEYDSGFTYPDETQKNKEFRNKVGVLYQYIHHTFSKVINEGKLIFTEDKNYAIMNTGLLTNTAEEIFMLFGVNTNKDDMRRYMLLGFYRESAHEIPTSLRSKLPEHIDYFVTCPEDIYFNVSYKITYNAEHIVETNFQRLPESLKSLGDKQFISTTLSSLINTMIKRVLRNHRLIVPQYYNHRIMYLAPLKFGKDIITLAIEKHENTYRANTILTMGMAYCNARLIAKPESNWLINK